MARDRRRRAAAILEVSAVRTRAEPDVSAVDASSLVFLGTWTFGCWLIATIATATLAMLSRFGHHVSDCPAVSVSVDPFAPYL